MKRLLILLAALTVLVGLMVAPAPAASPPLVPGGSVGNDPDEAWWEGITIPTKGVLPPAEVHPRMYVDAVGVQALRDRVGGDAPDPHGHYALAWRRLVADADRAASEPAVDENDNVKTKAAKATAFAWLITRQRRYLDAAAANLSAAFDTIASDDQYVSLQMTNYALAYDWVAADLAPDQDATIRAAVKRGATWLYDYLADPGVRSHNHRSKAGAALGSWALAFCADRAAQAYLDRGLENMNRVFRYMFTKDGIYRDGAGYYWTFTIINSTPLLWEYRNVSGVDLFPAMRPAFEWQLKTANPKGWMPPLDDAWYKPTWLHTVAAAYADTPTELSTTASLGELFQWRSFATDGNPVRYPDDWTGARDQYYGWPEEIALYDSTIPEAQPDGTPTIDLDAGPRGGDTIFRSDWRYGDAGTVWGYFNGVAMSNNHDHADGLQLLIDGENSVLAPDNGYGPLRFSGRNAWSGPQHHNVVTADGAAVGDPTPTRGFLHGAGFGFAEKSARYWNDRDASHTRAVAFPGSDYFIVLDHLEATTQKTWDTYWHGRGELSGAANRRTWTTADGPWGEAAQLHALTVSDAELSLASDQFNPFGTGIDTGFEGYPDPSTDVEDTTALRLTQVGAQADLLSVLVPSGTGPNDDPRLEDLGTDDVLAARVTTGGYRDVVVAPRSGGSASAAGLTTRASLGWARTVGGSLSGFAMHDGTSIARDGRTLAASSKPITISAGVTDPTRHTFEIAQTDEPYDLTLAASPDRPLTGVSLNGEPVAAATVDATIALTLAGGGDLVVTYGVPDHGPSRPHRLTAAGFTDTIELWWQPVQTATSYRVLRDGHQIAQVGVPSYTDRDVTRSRRYTYRVVAVNEAGQSRPSNTAVGSARLARPAAPEGLVISAGHRVAEFGWLPVRDADSYDVYRAAGDRPLERVAAGVSATEYVDTSVENGITYRYAVRAGNARGASGLSEVAVATPTAKPPTQPSRLIASRGIGSVTLTWDEAERADSYTVLRGGLTSSELNVVASGVTGPSYTDTSVANGTGYTYRVVAVNDAGASEPSRAVTAVPGCTPTYQIDPTSGAVIEGELYSGRSGEYRVIDAPGRFGGAVAQVPDGAEYKDNPNLWGRFDIEVAEPGRYNIQVLGRGFDGSSDSVYVSVDNGPLVTFNLSVNDWFYRQSPIGFDLDEGFHTVLIRAREDGALVDRFVMYPRDSIPDDVRFSPTWTEPTTCP